MITNGQKCLSQALNKVERVSIQTSGPSLQMTISFLISKGDGYQPTFGLMTSDIVKQPISCSFAGEDCQLRVDDCKCSKAPFLGTITKSMGDVNQFFVDD